MPEEQAVVQMPLLPLRDVVVFPHMVIPLFVGRPKSIKALETAMEAGKNIVLVAQKSAAQRALAEGLQSFRDVLTAQREQASGVSLDEELIKILQFQHSFQAAARIVSTVELLMNTLLQI